MPWWFTSALKHLPRGGAGDSVHKNATVTAAYRDGSVSVSEGQVGLDVGDALNNVFVRSS